jgi:hypothetical protein
MNETTKHATGILGTATTAGSTIIALLPTVNLIVQIGAGVTAIVVGILTARYYLKKTKELDEL